MNYDFCKDKLEKEALQTFQRKLSDIIDFLPDAILAIDNEQHVIIWNQAVEKMTGIPASEMIGKRNNAYSIPFYGEEKPQLLDLVFQDEDEIASRYSKLTREGDTFKAEVFCPALNNHKGAWVYVMAAPLYDQFGNIIGAIESVQDNNEVSQMMDKLQSKTIFLEAQANASLDGILVVDNNNKKILTNQRLYKLFDVPGTNLL